VPVPDRDVIGGESRSCLPRNELKRLQSRVPARRQSRHHGHHPAGPGRRHTCLGPHAAVTAKVTATPASVRPTRRTPTTTDASWIMP
jgi:hypothetical protein